MRTLHTTTVRLLLRSLPALLFFSCAAWSCSSAEPYEGGAVSSTSASSSSSSVCFSDSECPGPPDPRCGERQCINGSCRLTIYEGIQLQSQRPGDCHTVFCSVTGEVTTIYDPSDVPYDANECTLDLCISGEPVNKLYEEKSVCPESGEGVCFEGHCEVCALALQAYCGNGLICAYTICVSSQCYNNKVDGGETDYDCGGPCFPCFDEGKCKGPEDCYSKVCKNGICQYQTHSDGVQNTDETGVDCGCPDCTKKCVDGEACKAAAHCTSDLCYAGICQKPTCSDGTKNGDETGEDCGGPCTPCPDP